MKALGDYCGGVPPLPLPNREVKTASADGTAILCGRVGRRHSLNSSDSLLSRRFFFALKNYQTYNTRPIPDQLPAWNPILGEWKIKSAEPQMLFNKL